MYPNFYLIVIICSNHLFTYPHRPIYFCQAHKSLNNLFFMDFPICYLLNREFVLDFISINEESLIFTIMIKSYPANIWICLFHSLFELFNLIGIFYFHNMGTNTLSGQLTPKNRRVLRNLIPIFRKN